MSNNREIVKQIMSQCLQQNTVTMPSRHGGNIQIRLHIKEEEKKLYILWDFTSEEIDQIASITVRIRCFSCFGHFCLVFYKRKRKSMDYFLKSDREEGWWR